MIFSYYYYYSPLTLHSIPARYSTLCLTSAILVIYVSKLILPPPSFSYYPEHQVGLSYDRYILFFFDISVRIF